MKRTSTQTRSRRIKQRTQQSPSKTIASPSQLTTITSISSPIRTQSLPSDTASFTRQYATARRPSPTNAAVNRRSFANPDAQATSSLNISNFSTTAAQSAEEAQLLAISPVDGRYSRTTAPLSHIFSEYALIKNRTEVEVRWLQHMHNSGSFSHLSQFSTPTNDYLNDIVSNFTPQEALKVKAIEKITRHDVKAVEYYLGQKFADHEDLSKKTQWLHFACTSEDITNLSYAMMLQKSRNEVVLPYMDKIIDKLVELTVAHSDVPMMSRTHGQNATPTTVGKELGNFAIRLARQRKQFNQVEVMGKFNGAVGNYNAHVAVYPDVDWQQVSESFVKSLGISWTKYSTQIEPHDYIAEYFDSISRFNNILLDLNRDMWSYISLDYWKLANVPGEVGSSTMPHKVNPIDFENSEGNIGIANATFSHLSTKLQVSRWQRDLSDSTVLRSIGVGVAHSLIAYNSALIGLNKVELNSIAVKADLEHRWELMAEPVQTLMRANNVPDAYERLKAVTRGKAGISKSDVMDLLESVRTPENSSDIDRVLKITPLSYIGEAKKLALEVPDIVQSLRM